MAVYSGKFVDGKVVIEGDPPPDGTEVEVRVVEDGGEVWLTADMEDEIVQAIAELDRGEGIPAEQVLAEIRRPRGVPQSP